MNLVGGKKKNKNKHTGLQYWVFYLYKSQLLLEAQAYEDKSQWNK